MLETEPFYATIDDLYREPGKAELIGGRIVRLMPTGFRPNRVAGRLFKSLDDFAEESGRGYAATDNLAFTVPRLRSGRESFCPDASYFAGPLPSNEMRFISGAPDFAVEVRSEGDYGPSADVAVALKRTDYFEAGTRVVWDVDPVNQRISVYRSNSAEPDAVFGPGDTADAEPAVPGWRVAVDWIFR